MELLTWKNKTAALLVPQRGSGGWGGEWTLTSTKSLKTQRGSLVGGGASTLLHSHSVQLASASTSDQNSPSPRAAGRLVSEGNGLPVVLTESHLDCPSLPQDSSPQPPMLES